MGGDISAVSLECDGPGDSPASIFLFLPFFDWGGEGVSTSSGVGDLGAWGIAELVGKKLEPNQILTRAIRI